MSLRPADSWITDLTPTLTLMSSAHSPSIASSTNTGSTAGRFAILGSRMAQGSSGTGNEGEYNGGAKRAHLFLFDAVAQQGGSKICLGFVGQDNTRFCLRPANDQDPSTGTWFCGVQRHLIQFEPQDNTFYPRANEIIGFCSPSFPASLVPAQTLSEIKSERRTISEWAWLFKSFLSGTEDQDAPAPLKQLGFGVPVPLKTPSKTDDALSDLNRLMYYTPDGVRDIIRASQVGNTSWESLDSVPGLPADLL